MGLLDDIANKVEGEITEDNMSSAIESATSLAEKSLEGVELVLASAGLALLDENKGALTGLARGAAAGVLTSMAAGDTQRAMTLARAKVLTFGERRLLMRQGTDEALRAADKAKENAEAITSMLEEGGMLLLTKALPFILAAL